MTTIDALSNVAKQHGIAVGASTVALGAGFLAGYWFAKKRLEENLRIEQEEWVDQFVADYYKPSGEIVSDVEAKKPMTPEEAVQELIPEATGALRNYIQEEAETAVASYKGDGVVDGEGNFVPQRARLTRGDEEPTAEIPPERRNNVWGDDAEVHNPVEFDYREEILARDDEHPYIISEDEFTDNISSNDQTVILYFDVDEIYVDEESDGIIEDPDGFFGLHNVRFGHRSNNNDVVYIRHPLYDHDFTIKRVNGSYAEIVAGFIAGDVE